MLNKMRRAFQKQLPRIYFIGALVLVMGIALFVWAKRTYLFSHPDYITLSGAVADWEKNPTDMVEYAVLEKKLAGAKKESALFLPSITQKLLVIKQVERAFPIAQKTLSLTKEMTPYYESFAQTSLLIAKGEAAAAFTLAQQLQKEIDDDPLFSRHRKELIPFGDVLYTFNLLRMALLAEVLGNKSAEKEAWDAFTAAPEEARFAIAATFKETGFSLNDYIGYRREQL